MLYRAGGGAEPSAVSTARETKSHSRPAEPAAFWRSAQAGEPGESRHGARPVDPAALGISTELPPIDYPARVDALAAAADGEGPLQAAVADWFRTDPAAAREWLTVHGGREDLQPALALIACQISGTGDPAQALEWAALLHPGSPLKEQTIFDIYAEASRRRQFTEAELRAAPLPPERIEALVSGAGD